MRICSNLPQAKLIFIVTTLSMSGSFHFGYLIVIPNPALDAFQNFFNESFYEHYGSLLDGNQFRPVWSVFLNTLTIGGLVGCFLLKILTDKFGRKNSFYFAAVLQTLGATIGAVSYFALSWELMLFSRFISGIAIGISLGLQPMYFSEISPKDVRGCLNGMTGTMLELGFVLGSIVALPNVLGSKYVWHVLYWIQLTAILPTFVLLPFLYESPKYLLATRRNEPEAMNSLTFFLHSDPAAMVDEIRQEIESERDTVGLLEIFRTKYLRAGLLIGSAILIACQGSGIGAVSHFSTYLFIKAGIPEETAPYATVVVTFNTFLAAMLSSLFVDRIGRRPLILVGLASLIVLDIVYIGFSLLSKSTGAKWPGYVCVAETMTFTFMFGVGPAVVMWFVTAELMPQNARSTAMSFVQAISWIAMGVSNAIFFPLEGAIHEWSFLMFIVPMLIVAVYLYFKFPETKNKAPLEIMQTLGYKPTTKGISVHEEAKQTLL